MISTPTLVRLRSPPLTPLCLSSPMTVSRAAAMPSASMSVVTAGGATVTQAPAVSAERSAREAKMRTEMEQREQKAAGAADPTASWARVGL